MCGGRPAAAGCPASHLLDKQNSKQMNTITNNGQHIPHIYIYRHALKNAQFQQKMRVKTLGPGVPGPGPT